MQKPEKGFYYHYKHSSDDIYNYAYEVIGVARHTESEEYLVIYRPLYKSEFLEGVDASARPLEMFVDVVTKNGKTFPRFQKITDSELIKKLEQKRDEMYY